MSAAKNMSAASKGVSMDAARPALTDIERRTGKRLTGYKGQQRRRWKTWYGAMLPKNRVPCQPSKNAKAR